MLLFFSSSSLPEIRKKAKDFIEAKGVGTMSFARIMVEREEEILALLKQIVTQRKEPTELIIFIDEVSSNFLEKLLQLIEGNPYFRKLALDSYASFDLAKISIITDALARETCSLNELAWKLPKHNIHLQPLAEALRQNSSLLQLEFEGNTKSLPLRHLESVFQALLGSDERAEVQGNKNIKRVHLKHVSVSREDKKAVELLNLVLKTNPNIQELLFSSVDTIPEELLANLKDAENLTSLTLCSESTEQLNLKMLSVLERGLPPGLEVLELSTKYKGPTEHQDPEEKYQNFIKHQHAHIKRLNFPFFLNTESPQRKPPEANLDKSRLAEEYLEQFIEFLKKCKHKNFNLKLHASLLELIPYPKKKEYIHKIKPLLAEKDVYLDSCLPHTGIYKKQRQHAVFFTVLAHAKRNQDFDDLESAFLENSDPSELEFAVEEDTDEVESSISSCRAF